MLALFKGYWTLNLTLATNFFVQISQLLGRSSTLSDRILIEGNRTYGPQRKKK
jgi:hypothetical protein